MVPYLLDHLKKPLDDYLAEPGLEKVKVVRTPAREGLIRARLLGYAVATGEILTFLDSHVECFPGNHHNAKVSRGVQIT